MTVSYKKAVEILTAKEKFHISLGLNRVKNILKYFDNPQDKLKIIHVAGTNGKGSVCTILSRILTKQGYKTALFTSPHILKYTERLKINDKNISDKEFLSLIKEVQKKAKKENIPLTEFELLTVIALIWFKKENVDIAILEVGLGGRLDATNIIKKPILEIITSISLDHTDRLGNTIEKIAFEKAGIIKPKTICITTTQNKEISTLKSTAQKLQAKLITPSISALIENNIATINQKKYIFKLNAKYQEENLELVFEAIKQLRLQGYKIDEKTIQKALKTVKHPARFELLNGINLIADGAHNPDGARALRETLDKTFPNKKIIFIYATINTKDYKKIITTLLHSNDEIYFYDFKRINAVSVKELANFTKVKLKLINNTEEIIKLAQENISTKTPVIITGSLYAIGDMYKDLINGIKKTAQMANLQ